MKKHLGTITLTVLMFACATVLWVQGQSIGKDQRIAVQGDVPLGVSEAHISASELQVMRAASWKTLHYQQGLDYARKMGFAPMAKHFQELSRRQASAK